MSKYAVHSHTQYASFFCVPICVWEHLICLKFDMVAQQASFQQKKDFFGLKKARIFAEIYTSLKKVRKNEKTKDRKNESISTYWYLLFTFFFVLYIL